MWQQNNERENEINIERKTYNIDMKILEHELTSKIKWIQNKTAFYIDALEAAHNQTILVKNQEIDRLDMIVSDLVGQRTRELIPDDEINRLLKIDHTLE
jgi:hypothetical protein